MEVKALAKKNTKPDRQQLHQSEKQKQSVHERTPISLVQISGLPIEEQRSDWQQKCRNMNSFVPSTQSRQSFASTGKCQPSLALPSPDCCAMLQKKKKKKPAYKCTAVHKNISLSSSPQCIGPTLFFQLLESTQVYKMFQNAQAHARTHCT